MPPKLDDFYWECFFQGVYIQLNDTDGGKCTSVSVTTVPSVMHDQQELM